MVCHPNDEEPAGPVGAAEHKDSDEDRDKPDQANPDELRPQERLGLELGDLLRQQKVSECYRPNRYEYPTNDRDGAWTFGHGAQEAWLAVTRVRIHSIDHKAQGIVKARFGWAVLMNRAFSARGRFGQWTQRLALSCYERPLGVSTCPLPPPPAPVGGTYGRGRWRLSVSAGPIKLLFL